MRAPDGIAPENVRQWDTSDFYRPDDPDWTEWDAQFEQDDAWADVTDTLTTWMTALGEPARNGDYWHVTLKNFGWRHTNNEGVVKATDGTDLLQRVLPRTDCTFTIWRTDTTIEIDNAHHDAPTGGERYTIRVATEEEISE